MAIVMPEWIENLLAEARRDVVYVFNITQGAYGGPKPMPSEAELPGLIEQVAEALLQRGCVVGFGDPDSNKWRVPNELHVPFEHKPSAISRSWVKSPEEFQFLVFALRRHNEHAA